MFKHICLVPNEWSEYYSQDVLEVILKKDMSCDSISKKVKGVKIKVNGTTAKLRYYGNQPWMRKVQDKRSCPDTREYFGVYMSCNDCRKPYVIFYLKIKFTSASLRYHVQNFWLCKDGHIEQVALYLEENYVFFIPSIQCEDL